MTDLLSAATSERPQLPSYPMTRQAGCPFDPPPLLRELNSAKPLHRVRIWNGTTPWLVTGYHEARTLFADPRVSVDDRQPNFPHWNEAMSRLALKRVKTMVTADGAEHTRFRRMMAKPFTFRRIETLRYDIQAITDAHIDSMLAGPQPADLVAALALPIPSQVISKLLGVPYEDADFFQEAANNGLARFATAEESKRNAKGLHKYLITLVEQKMAEPAEDAVSDLGERVRAGELTVKEAAEAANTLLIGGHETTGNMIGLGVLAFLTHPEQLVAFRGMDDQKAIAIAVEELVRYLSIIQNGQRRVASEDIEVAGETIRAGDGIIVDLVPANWDISVFDAPGNLNLFRHNASAHLGFGFGRHQCIGQSLARLELQIVFATLFQRVPTLQLAVPFDQVPLKDDRLAYGAYELPVRW